MILRHNPFGSGHPYRYDLDQRVPQRPLVGETVEIRLVSSSDIESVVVILDDGQRLLARRAGPNELVQDHGAQPSGQTAAGHLAAAAESDSSAAGTQCWVATFVANRTISYHAVAEGPEGQSSTETFMLSPATWSLAGGDLSRSGSSDRLDEGSVRWLVSAEGTHRVKFRMRLDKGQHISGLGERFNALDHRGQKLDAVVFEQYKHQGERTYLPAPMAIIVGGDHWGFHLDTTHRSWYDFGSTNPDWIEVEVEVDPTNPRLDVGVWAGQPSSIVQSFLKRTGEPGLAPEWVFKTWMSGNEWNTQERVEAEVARSLAEDIPVGAIVIEAWSDESTFTAFRDAIYEVNQDGSPHQLDDFTFPADGAWPDPFGMVERLHAQGVKVLLWQIPLLPTDRGSSGQIAADLESIEALDYCVRDSDGSVHHNRGWWFPGAVLPDFTSDTVRKWWTDKRRYLLDEVGIDGFKTDGGEHLWGHDLVFSDGTSGAESNNRFPVLFAEAYHELMQRSSVDGVTFSRAGFAGSAAFPCHWAGDEDSTWEAFRASITAGLNAGIAGLYYWAWDLAGFSGELPDPELYLRSTAMATFSPIMQYHSEFNNHQVPNVDRTPWNIAERWKDQTVIDHYRTFVKLRLRLVPYLASQMRLSIEGGRPLMRPLCFDYPDDEKIWGYPMQYQLGDDLLVAPITTPAAVSIEVYLPAGEWTDCYSGEQHVGPAVVDRTVGLNEIAVFRRRESADELCGVFAF